MACCQVLKKGLQEVEKSDPRLPDCKAAVFGLTQLLKEVLYRPGPLAEQVFSVLVSFLQQLYAGNCFTATSCVLRINVRRQSSPQSLLMLLSFSLQIFNCLLRLRADKMGQLGFIDDESPELKYSPFNVCIDGGQRSMPFSCNILHLRGVFDAVQSCLYRVGSWSCVGREVCATCLWFIGCGVGGCVSADASLNRNPPVPHSDSLSNARSLSPHSSTVLSD